MTNKLYNARRQAESYLRRCKHCTKTCNGKCNARYNAQQALAAAGASATEFERLGLTPVAPVRYDRRTGIRIA